MFNFIRYIIGEGVVVNVLSPIFSLVSISIIILQATMTFGGALAQSLGFFVRQNDPNYAAIINKKHVRPGCTSVAIQRYSGLRDTTQWISCLRVGIHDYIGTDFLTIRGTLLHVDAVFIHHRHKIAILIKDRSFICLSLVLDLAGCIVGHPDWFRERTILSDIHSGRIRIIYPTEKIRFAQIAVPDIRLVIHRGTTHAVSRTGGFTDAQTSGIFLPCQRPSLLVGRCDKLQRITPARSEAFWFRPYACSVLCVDHASRSPHAAERRIFVRNIGVAHLTTLDKKPVAFAVATAQFVIIVGAIFISSIRTVPISLVFRHASLAVGARPGDQNLVTLRNNRRLEVITMKCKGCYFAL
mmetsp:Transcript_16061/g.29021  ORF Transcript_16061/g.29021 Transcript_16061/m.29021 type:complete len:354 (-) Transcript_16061:894-1955(-)